MGVFKDKAGLDEGVFPIEGHAVEEDHAFGVDEDFDSVEFEDMVSGTGLRIELELIAQTGAAAAQYAETEATIGDSLAGEGGTNFGYGLRGNLNGGLYGYG